MTETSSRSEIVRLLRWPLVFVAVALLGLFGWLATLDRAGDGGRAIGDAAGAVADRAERLAGTFFSGDVSERFTASMPRVSAVEEGALQVARLEITETLRRSDERRLAWDLLPLGKTTAEIQVPVTYRYHVLLDDPWKVEIHGPVALVMAPAIRPTQPPAIHTDGMQRRTTEGLFRFDGAEQMADLERSLTPRLVDRAASDQYRDLVRDEARRSIADFVRKWLLGQEFWVDDRFATVRVVFADELAVDGPEEAAPIVPSVVVETHEPTGRTP
ncbi:MAG: hypothetical protein AAGE94_16570 [Acidobacteriota bacterium]